MRAKARFWLPWLASALALSLALAGLDPVGRPFSAWAAYLVIFTLGVVVYGVTWRWLAWRDAPRWLGACLAMALLVRLAVGVGLTRALPISGYPDNRAHHAGFVFQDAFTRDRDAWILAKSDETVLNAFKEGVRADQYGGLLFFSSLTYRLLSPEVHRPLLVLVAAALVSALAVLFAWGFTAMTFGGVAAGIAAWTVALYPEAVLLGASQMREPFVITAFSLALFGYAQARLGGVRSGLLAILIGTLLALLISPPYALILTGVISLAWIWEGRVDPKHTRWAFAGLAVIAALGLALTIRSWGRIENAPDSGPLGLLSWWLSSGARFELYRLEEASGWVQKIFELTPDWAHLPLATVNGLVQPFLPAALMDSTSLPLPRLISSLRAVGWFTLLPFLLYAPLAALRKAGWRSLQVYLAVIVWVTAILASYRLAGDQWDNPRARAVFVIPQAALTGWAWVHARWGRSPWLARTGVVVGMATLLFLQWYAGRYYGLPRLNLWQTLAGVGAFTAVFIGGALVWDGWRARRFRGLTDEPREV